MKAMVGVVAIACAVGCNVDSPDLATAETAQAIGGRCPDPDNCTVSNGGGVYTEENGNAHIGPASEDFMILRFINDPVNGGVTLKGRKFDSYTGNYVASYGTVDYALYNGQQIPVYSVSETLTTPKFVLGDANNNQGVSDLQNLRVVITAGKRYTLSWASAVPDTGTTGYTPGTLQTYVMSWNDGTAYNASTATPYCYRADGTVDSVVFQGGIAVNPVNAAMARATAVTLSCRYGAIATARWWGYIYRGDDSQLTMFEAAMKMKRASYCGDEDFFTKSGTELYIHDNIPDQHDTLYVQDIEASWGVGTDGLIHARCVNPNNYRRPGIVSNKGFDPTCNGRFAAPGLPDCATWGNGLGSLAEKRKF